MSVLDQPHLERFLLFLRTQRYDRDGGHKNPRHRIEFDYDSLVKEIPDFGPLEQMTMPCVACGSSIHPFRQRKVSTKPGRKAAASGKWYYAVSCPQNVNNSCSRGKAASDEYKRVVQFVKELPKKPSRQGDFFEGTEK